MKKGKNLTKSFLKVNKWRESWKKNEWGLLEMLLFVSALIAWVFVYEQEAVSFILDLLSEFFLESFLFKRLSEKMIKAESNDTDFFNHRKNKIEKIMNWRANFSEGRCLL